MEREGMGTGLLAGSEKASGCGCKQCEETGKVLLSSSCLFFKHSLSHKS